MNKSKLTTSTLAIKNIMSHKRNYLTMLVGIIFAMVFSSGILFFISSLKTSMDEMANRRIGTQDVILQNAQMFELDSQPYKSQIKEKGFAHILGYAYTDDEKAGTLAAYFDDKAKELSRSSVTQGRFPKKSGEIAIESDALAEMGLDKKIGDKITVNFKIADKDRYLEKEVRKTYTIVGILYNQKKNITRNANSDDKEFEYPAIVLSSKEKQEMGTAERTMAFCNLNKMGNNWAAESVFKSAICDDLIEKKIISTEKKDLADLFVNTRHSNLNKPLFDTEYMVYQTVIANTLIFMLLVASAIGIINSFNSNLQARKKQIGLYRAVGATRIQIIKIFGKEALLIGIVSVPISLLIAFIFTKLVIGFMGKDFVFIPQWWVLILSGAFSLLCVMLASLIPLINAARISPMQTVRDIELVRKMRSKKIKSKMKFDVSGLVAGRNLMFSRGRQVSVSIILAMTVVLSGFGLGFVKVISEDLERTLVKNDYILQNMNIVGASNYDFTLYNAKGDLRYTPISNKRMNEILSLPNVKRVQGSKKATANIVFDGEIPDYMLNFLTLMNANSADNYNTYRDIETFRKYINDNLDKGYLDFKDKVYNGKNFVDTEFSAYSDEHIRTLEEHLIDGKIDMDKLNLGEEIILVASPEIIVDDNGYLHRVEKEHEFHSRNIRTKLNYKVGDIVTISILSSEDIKPKMDENNSPRYHIPSDLKNDERKVRIGAIVDLSQDTDFSMLTTISGFEKFYKDYPYFDLNIDMDLKCTDEINEYMLYSLDRLTRGGYISVISAFDQNKDNRMLVTSCYVAMTSLIILFFTIAASIINNSITGQIRKSKREIGTLRAVGASQKELRSIYLKELLSMFGWGVGVGTALYFVLFSIFTVIDKVIGININMDLIILPSFLVCILLFLICGLNVSLKVKQQMKNSIVENIREL